MSAQQDGKVDRMGPQGTTLFNASELAEVIESPSADLEGDIGKAALVGLAPPFMDQRFVLNRGKTQIGRREDNDIVLPDGSVSAQHAWILYDNGRYRVMNMLSTNGTFLHDNKVRDALLNEGDRLRFGRAEFVFRAGMNAQMEPDTAGFRPGMPLIWTVAAVIVLLALAGVLLF